MRRVIIIVGKQFSFLVRRDFLLDICKSGESVVEALQEKADELNRKILSISWWKETKGDEKPQVSNDIEGLKRALVRELKSNNPKEIRVTVQFTPDGEHGNEANYTLKIKEVK